MVSGHLGNVTKAPEYETIALHSAQEPDPINASRALLLYQTCSYNFTDAADGTSKFAWSKKEKDTFFEQRMAMLEGGAGAVATASEYSAQFMAITSICKPGHNFVSTMNLYGRTFNQFRVYFKVNIPCKFVEGSDPQNIKNAIDDKTRAVYVETIGNPQFNVPNLKAISEVCHHAGIRLIVDNTFGMGGYLCKPIEIGADIITSSVTKWIGGHGTSMGAVDEPADGDHGMRFWETYGYEPLSARVRMDAMRDLGPCISPFNAWLFVNYPGLESHSDYELAQRVLPKGWGGVLTFCIAGNIKEVAAVVDSLKLCSHLANVGHAKTLIIPDEEKIKGGITPYLIRVSLA
ncbi:PLP-dependent transferase [Macroventuria anomochaeta]|uniref:PLP-dependent transferase n=1 Tax=Macroventuria anomochaeta TaxID=301207 RepID=A0ACB6SIR3_9PLEO|nr:PLP-dependent transferase [Macroventuria anomochaeta]KAF2633417.1 PLP-dependent transferase [Macroventuria anomochaeta]